MTYRYEVTITGHEAPFKWKVTRKGDGKDFCPSSCNGESDSREEALFDAAEVAREAEHRRKHDATKETLELFRVDDEPSYDTPPPVPPASLFRFESPYDGA